MNRTLGLSALLAGALLLPVAASANSIGTSATSSVFKSYKCSGPIKPYDFRSQACATLTVPKTVVAGQPFKAKYTFAARTKLKNIAICLTKVQLTASTKCAFKAKRSVIMPGKPVKTTVTMTVPASTPPGNYGLNDASRFYKLPKYADKSDYWSLRGAVVHVVSAD